MISRRTLYSLLLTLLLAGGLWVWSAEHRDECSAWLTGDRGAPSTQVVESGTRLIVVPCTQWLPRQSRIVQGLCLVILGGAAVLLVSVWTDWKRSRW